MHRPPLRTAIVVATLSIVALSISACGSDSSPEAVRAYTLHLRAEDADPSHYRYVAEDALDIQVGDRVTIQVSNVGALPHDLEVRQPDGQVVATAPVAAAAGGTTQVVVDFTQTGVYSLRCNVGDHLTKHDMQAMIEVGPADTTA